MTSPRPDIARLVEFQKLLAQFSQIDRRLHRRHGKAMRQENDSEHSYNLAMTAFLLSEHFPNLNQAMLLKYALVHDLVELHAGDTYAYAPEAVIATKLEREANAAQQLKREWPDFPELHKLIHDYEVHADPEAKFIYALDKIMPVMQIFIHEGYTWKKQDINLKMLQDKKDSQIALSPEIQSYWRQLVDVLAASPYIANE